VPACSRPQRGYELQPACPPARWPMNRRRRLAGTARWWPDGAASPVACSGRARLRYFAHNASLLTRYRRRPGLAPARCLMHLRHPLATGEPAGPPDFRTAAVDIRAPGYRVLRYPTSTAAALQPRGTFKPSDLYGGSLHIVYD
jgi:hypothetical protein